MHDAVLRLQQTLRADYAVLLEYAHVVTSTNSVLLERGRTGQRQPTLLWAEQQTAGRARARRTWYSQSGQALTFSLGFSAHFRAGLQGLSVAVGWALAQALDPQETLGLQLKWPNDLMWRERKLGGILVEALGQGAQPWVVVGVGINISAPPDYPFAYRRAPAWWQECDAQASCMSCMAVLAPALCTAMQQFSQQGLGPIVAHWRRRDALWQRAITMQCGHQQLAGTAQGINAEGALRLHNAHGVRFVHAGEVSHVNWTARTVD